jgi:hypothetical protein
MRSKAHRRVRRKRTESGALQILEEAFHLVRTLDPAAFCWYAAGAVPWAVGLLYFAADMGRSSLAGRDAAFAAVAMTLLWMWMRFTQAKFGAALWDRLNPGHRPDQGIAGRARALAALWFLQAFQIPMVAVGLFFAIPLGWILATQQNLSVLALTRSHGDRPLRNLLGTAIRYSHDQWAQNHGLLLIFFFVFLFTEINLVSTCIILPGLAKAVFGIESVFTLAPTVATSNTTFVLGTLLLTQLAIMPLYHAAYGLRCFYAGSRTSGADLLGRLAECREKRGIEDRRDRAALGRVAGVIFLLGCGVPGLAAAEASGDAGARVEASAAPVDADRFRSEVSETLEQKKYQWQLSRRSLEGEVEAGDSWLGQRLEEIADSVKRALKQVDDWIEDSIKRFFEQDQGASRRGRDEGAGFLKTLGSTGSLVLVVVILALILWLALVMYRRYRGQERVELPDEGGGGPIDLESEDIVATQLHEEEWLRLAREQIGKGEERLAIRALFLATLAHLGERGLLKIARFKSNRDYRNELLLRARSLAELRRAFDENTALFERVWYGLHPPGSGTVEGYLRNHGLIAEESTKAAHRPPAAVGRRS